MRKNSSNSKASLKAPKKLCPTHPEVLCTDLDVDPGYFCYKCRPPSRKNSTKSIPETVSVKQRAKDFAPAHLNVAEKKKEIIKHMDAKAKKPFISTYFLRLLYLCIVRVSYHAECAVEGTAAHSAAASVSATKDPMSIASFPVSRHTTKETDEHEQPQTETSHVPDTDEGLFLVNDHFTYADFLRLVISDAEYENA